MLDDFDLVKLEPVFSEDVQVSIKAINAYRCAENVSELNNCGKVKICIVPREGGTLRGLPRHRHMIS